MSDDDIDFSKALAKYRDESGDDRDFADLEPAVQHEILKRAQGLKPNAKEKSGAKANKSQAKLLKHPGSTSSTF